MELEKEIEIPHDPTVAYVAAVVVGAAVAMRMKTEEGTVSRITVKIHHCDELIPRITPTQVLLEIQDEKRVWEVVAHDNSIVPRVMDVTLLGDMIVGTFEEGLDSE